MMRLLAFFVVFLLVLVSGYSFAGTITTSAGQVFTVESTSCVDVLAGVNAYWKVDPQSHIRGVACTDDPVKVGSAILWNTALIGNGTAAKLSYSSSVSAVSAPAQTVTLASLNAAVLSLQASGGSSEPFDYVKAAALFSFFFSFVVGVWIVGKNIGLIINAVRHW